MIQRPTRLFAFDLCLALGWPHPDFLLPHLSASQIADWRVYSRLRPFGFHRDNLMTANIGATVANYANGSSKKTAHKISDFVLKTKADKKPQVTSAQVKAIFGVG